MLSLPKEVAAVIKSFWIILDGNMLLNLLREFGIYVIYKDKFIHNPLGEFCKIISITKRVFQDSNDIFVSFLTNEINFSIFPNLLKDQITRHTGKNASWLNKACVTSGKLKYLPKFECSIIFTTSRGTRRQVDIPMRYEKYFRGLMITQLYKAELFYEEEKVLYGAKIFLNVILKTMSKKTIIAQLEQQLHNSSTALICDEHIFEVDLSPKLLRDIIC